MSLAVPLRKKRTQMAPILPSGNLLELLPGEIAIAQANKAQQLIYFTEKSGCLSFPVSGTILCTNHRICFIPDVSKVELPDESGRCLLTASKHIPLGCIHQVNIISSKTKKVLDGVSTLPKRLGHLEIISKDIKRLLFSLKNAPKSEATSLINAIGRHTHPSSVHLLFAFDYTRALKDSRRHDNYSTTDPQNLSFLNPLDWQRELLRLGITNDQWRVSEANKNFLVCDSLCPFFPCPTSFSDMSLDNAASVHTNNRIPVWCWSHPCTGVSLTRGGSMVVADEQEAPDPNYRVCIAMARHTEQQVENKGVVLFDVIRKCGSVKHLHSAFNKIRELCTPSGSAELSAIDRHWYGGLESSGWLAMVRASLMAAKEVTHILCIKRRSVMLLENTGSDLSCVLCSLVELMADPHYRSISGFESLVQKEWVALGHSFTTRHGLTTNTHGEEEAPVFLLFLDCVWQLSRQFPSAFEFSEFFLLRFYDMVLECLYSNFLFDSVKDRLQASLYSRRSCFFGMGDEPLELVDDYEGPLFSAWGRWRESMKNEENEQCLNPLYYIFGSGDAEYENDSSNDHLGNILSNSTKITDIGSFGLYGDRESTPMSICSQDVDYYRQGLLIPETSLCSLRVWDGFFFRYLPDLGVCHMKEVLEVQQLESRMVKDVQKLKEELNEMELTLGTFATDLPTYVGEVVQERERERQLLVERRESVEMGVSLRPRLTASMYSYNEMDEMVPEVSSAKEGTEEIDGAGPFIQKSSDSTPVNSPLKISPPKQQDPQLLNGGSAAHIRSAPESPRQPSKTSLAQFTDALYSSEMEKGGGLRPKALAEISSTSQVGVGPSRSPVTKTRLRVVMGEKGDPVVAPWQSSPRQLIRHKELDKTHEIVVDAPVTLSTASQLTEL